MHSKNTHRYHQVGHWMPPNYDAHHKWLGGVIAHVDSNEKELHPVLKEFQHLIESNTRVYLLIASMFAEVPKNRHYCTDPTGCAQIRDYPHMLQVLNYLLTTAPSWNDFSMEVGLVGLPINAVLDWSMGTPSGYAAYLDPDINAMLKKVLNAWGEYLTSPDSANVLDDSEHGWFGHGKGNLEHVANIARDTDHKFEQLFVCDPKAKHHGYKSWDDFFTRLFRPGVRPVAAPDDNKVIANACESQPYKVARNVKAKDTFWMKGQPYSVFDMLSHDDLAPQFEGGTVYQAFLSALSYHRWHSPVNGKIVKAYVVDGTYYSEPLFEGLSGEKNDHPGMQKIDSGGEVTTQEYLTCVATRAIIFIECDDPAVGLVAFLGVGMCEVSTCEITVKEGQKVKKGDQLGMFHFGGSTHCLVFRKGVEVEGLPSPELKKNVPINGQLGVVKG
ncbi:Phophatidylserine decarboxylase-domain-containing protein [Aspergillus unguis]